MASDQPQPPLQQPPQDNEPQPPQPPPIVDAQTTSNRESFEAEVEAAFRSQTASLEQRDTQWQGRIDDLSALITQVTMTNDQKIAAIEQAINQLVQGTQQASGIAQAAGQAAVQGQQMAHQAGAAAAQAAAIPAAGVPQPGGVAIPSLAPVPHVKPPQPPKFRGADKTPRILEWTHQAGQFLKSANLENSTTGVWHITNYLQDEAAVWWRLYCADVENGRAPAINNWLELKTLMLMRFSEVNRTVAIKDQYSNLKQTGSVRAYISKFRELVVELPNETEWDRVYQFLKGLKPVIQSNTRTHKPKTLEEAMDIADEADRAIYHARGGGYRAAFANPKQQGNGPRAMDLGAVSLSESEKQRCIRDGLCFNCKKPDHAARDCPQKDRGGRGGGGARGRRRGGRGRRRSEN